MLNNFKQLYSKTIFLKIEHKYTRSYFCIGYIDITLLFTGQLVDLPTMSYETLNFLASRKSIRPSDTMPLEWNCGTNCSALLSSLFVEDSVFEAGLLNINVVLFNNVSSASSNQSVQLERPIVGLSANYIAGYRELNK